MQTAVNIVTVLLPIAYTVLVVAYAHRFLGRERGMVRRRHAVLAATVALHALSILLRSAASRTCPVGSPAEMLSIVAFSTVVVHLAIEWRLGADNTTGVFVIALALATQCAAIVLGLGGGVALRFAFLPSLHIFTGLAGLAAVAVASTYSLLYLFLYRAIKRGSFGLYYQRMPDLELLSTINYRAARVAFVAVSATVAVGAAWMLERTGEAHTPFAIITLALALWLLYAGVVLGHRFFGLGGKRLAYSTLVGFLFGVSIIAIIASRGASP